MRRKHLPIVMVTTALTRVQNRFGAHTLASVKAAHFSQGAILVRLALVLYRSNTLVWFGQRWTLQGFTYRTTVIYTVT